MKKVLTYKCLLFTIFSLGSTVHASDSKSNSLRAFSEVPKMKNTRAHNKRLLNQINDLVGESVDLTLFDKKKEGWSVYGKISRVSKLGLRYNY
ncbi:MAG: hypothetical protein K0U47_03325 [Epsilonproteobacteria bacterium]|nr:hypothetical protein [Campylobacterota bacterium]